MAAVDRAPAGDDAVARHLLLGHAEIGGAVGDIHVVFFERALVEQHVEALARRQLALGVLGVDALLSTAKAGFRAAGFELLEHGAHQLMPLARRREERLAKVIDWLRNHGWTSDRRAALPCSIGGWNQHENG